MCPVVLKLLFVIFTSVVVSGILLALYLFFTSPDNKKMFKEVKELFKDEKGNKDGSL